MCVCILNSLWTNSSCLDKTREILMNLSICWDARCSTSCFEIIFFWLQGIQIIMKGIHQRPKFTKQQMDDLLFHRLCCCVWQEQWNGKSLTHLLIGGFDCLFVCFCVNLRCFWSFCTRNFDKKKTIDSHAVDLYEYIVIPSHLATEKNGRLRWLECR